MSEYIGHAIIPCAGKGSRVGSPPQGKEMLTDPTTGGKIIDFALDLCARERLKPIIIVSSKKLELVDYVSKRAPDAMFVVHDPTAYEEWPHSVLASEAAWHEEHNLLILPDSRFAFTYKPDFTSKTNDFYAVRVNEPSKFGVIVELVDNCIRTSEKPSEEDKLVSAWGLIKFTKTVGKYLFLGYTNRGFWIEVPNAKAIPLSFFKDITRRGYVEEY